MRFVHLSDLHLGKRVHEFSMMEDQKYILRQILKIIEEKKADAVVIAGDVYDKSVPSAEAVRLLDDFLIRLAKLSVPVLMISGNHDSSERLAFGAKFMKQSQIYISPVYDGTVVPVTFQDEYGEVDVYLLPFLKPAMVRSTGREDAEEIKSYQETLLAAVEWMHPDFTRRNLLVSHQFVTGAGRSDSEEISVGGLDNVDGSVFDGFDYVALGHIHGPQHIGRETLRYCGTPLKYSFSEASQEKSVTLVELKEKGRVEIETVPLKPLRDMRKIKGSYMELSDRKNYEGQNTEDYIHVTLTDEEDVPDAMAKLRSIYPNLMQLEYDNRRTRENRRIDVSEDMEEKTEIELFEDFYALQNNEEMSPIQKEFMTSVIEKIREDEQ